MTMTILMTQYQWEFEWHNINDNDNNNDNDLIIQIEDPTTQVVNNDNEMKYEGHEELITSMLQWFSL